MQAFGQSAGLDFGTTNTVAVIADGTLGEPRLLAFDGPNGKEEVFRSALCFWHDEDVRGGLAAEAGPDAIARMIAMVENELGFSLHDAVGRLKRTMSEAERATFRFSGAGVEIEAEVTRAQFESWIANDVARIAATLDNALAHAGVTEAEIDRVFLTGGTSLVPAVRSIFAARFGTPKIASGGELTSIAHGLALIAGEEDPSVWAAQG